LQIASESLGIVWPVEVLRRIKGVDFPADKSVLKERLSGLKIEGKNIDEILEKLNYPIKSPAQLLANIREHL